MNTDNNRNIQNRKCSYENAEQEIEARHQVGAEVIKVYRKILPDLLKDLSKIEDPRNPQKIKHTHVMLMLYGILLYVFHVL